MSDAEWYASMASAMKSRERCLTAIAKWEGLLVEAEAEIQALRDGDVGDPVTDDPDARLATAVSDWKAQQETQDPATAPSI